MADMIYGTNAAGGDMTEDNGAEFYSGMNSNNNRQRYPGLYIGNLTWWTTDQDVINNINGIGVTDVQEVKFFENRNNGQSKGFCVVTFNSETSLPIVMEKLPKTELHGQNPVVTPYNRQNLNLFESQTKTRPQINNSNNGPPNSHAAGIMGISSISGVHANTQGLPYSAGGAGGGVGAGLGGIGGVPGMNNNYNQQQAGSMGPGGMLGGGPGVGGPRVPSNYHGNMRMQMRAPRPVLRGSLNPNSMNPNGPMISSSGGHQVNRMRFMQPQQGWNNSQSAYNPNSSGVGSRMPQMNMDLSSRLGLGNSGKPDDLGAGGAGVGQDLISGMTSQSYYTPHHGGSQSEQHYRDLRDHHRDRDHREHDRDSSSRRLDDRPSRQDDRSHRHSDERSIRQDDRSSMLKHEHHDRSSSRRGGDDRSSSRRGEERSSSSSRHHEDSRREERSSKREKESSSSRREKSHHRSSDDRTRSRSRDRSRERKDRKERRDRY